MEVLEALAQEIETNEEKIEEIEAVVSNLELKITRVTERRHCSIAWISSIPLLLLAVMYYLY
jgi:hypothetical protein